MAYPQFKFLPKKFPPRPSLQRRDWLKVDADGDYILSWAMTAPNELQSIIVQQVLGQDELIQANAIIECLQNIYPPKSDPDKWRFLIQVGDNHSFVDFRIVREDVKATRVGEYRSQTLSLIPRDWYQGGYDRLVKRFHREFFGHKPSIREMEKFILDDDNFHVDYKSALFSSNFRGPQINY